MDKTFINGHERIEHDFGYFPSFHDDVIDKTEISSKGITFLRSAMEQSLFLFEVEIRN